MLNIFDKIKRWWRRVISPKQIEDKLKLVPAISTDMENSINEWYAIYKDAELVDDCGNKLKTLNLGYAIANEKARMACLEMQYQVYDPNITEESDEVDTNTRAGYIHTQLSTLMKNFRHKIAPGVALGTMVIKPIPDVEGGKIQFEMVLANEFFPISFTMDGKLSSAVFVERIVKKSNSYTRLETHELKGGTITIKQEAYKNYSSVGGTDLGSKIALTEVPEWATLQASTTITSTNGVKLDRLLVACFKMPEANNIDVHSQLGISAYAPATKLIRNANEIYSGLMWEMEAGEMAIDAPRGVLRTELDKNGNPKVIPTRRQQRLFREINVSSASGDDIYNVYNPDFRDGSYDNVLNLVLNRIEDTVSIARGSISNVDVIAKTATEIKSLKQRTYQSNKDLQESLEDTLLDVVYILDIYTSLYELAPSGEYSTRFDWDDSILVDVAEELRQKLSLANSGAIFPEEVAAWYRNETLEQRFQDIQKFKELKQQYDPEIDVDPLE